MGREGIIKECVMQFRMFSREANTYAGRAIVWCVESPHVVLTVKLEVLKTFIHGLKLLVSPFYVCAEKGY